MISPDEAQARVLALGVPVSAETVPLLDGAGRWAASDVTARRTQPVCDLSAMDGYAVRLADVPGPWRIVGESAAGSPFCGSVGIGEAARIFTGAAMPAGADTIIVQEDAAIVDGALTLTGEGPALTGMHVRRAGSDFTSGDRLLAAGDALTPRALALAAMGGHGSIDVHRRVRVAIVSTGNELVAAGTAAGTDRLPDSNTPMLAAMLGSLPVEIVDLGIVVDDRVALAAVITRARDCDILVTIGGASVGDHDLVRPVLLEMGAALDFWKVAMRPGKPMMAGRLGDNVVIGLPGNPVSAFVTALLFVLPLVRRLSGARDALPRRVAATCRDPLPAVGPRTDFVRARWDGTALSALPSNDSGIVSRLAQADALIVRPAGAPATVPEQAVEVILLG